MQDNQEARAKGRIGISERNETFTSIARAQAHLYILTFHTLWKNWYHDSRIQYSQTSKLSNIGKKQDKSLSFYTLFKTS